MKKFTIIVTHYNQMNYIKEALESVLNQNYKNIELIVADDGSPSFERKKVEKYIKNKNKKRFEYKILDPKVNNGTVKNINNAVKEASGDYIMFFAADDKLYDENVVSNFIKAFEDEKRNIITTQCLLYDDKFIKLFGKFVNKYKSWIYNYKSVKSNYARMAIGCCYGSGGTAYRKEIFEKYGLFDEQYIFVEDWSYWLKVLREGEKLYYCNFYTLCHRDGGISHSEYSAYTIPKHVRQYYFDISNIYCNEIFPYFDRFNIIEKYKILRQYHETITYYSSFVPEINDYFKYYESVKSKNKVFNFIWKSLLFYRYFQLHIIRKIKILMKYNKLVVINFFTWLLFNIFFINELNINNDYLLLTIYIIDYFISFIIINGLYKSINFIINRKTGGLNVQ